MRIFIKTIPHREQRYPTVGDWQWKIGSDFPSSNFEPNELVLLIRVSAMGNWRFEALVAIHEMIEAIIARSNGVSEREVDDFDIEFERKRLEGDEREPGDQMNCPVYNEHQTATGVERLILPLLGVSWSSYEKTINELFTSKPLSDDDVPF